MRLKNSLIVLLVMALIVSIPVLAEEEEEVMDQQQLQQQQLQEQQQQVVAEVNDEEITMQELEQFSGMQQIIMTLYQSGQQSQQFVQMLLQTQSGQEFLDEYNKKQLDVLIEEKLLEAEAKDRGITVTDEDKEALFKNQFLNPYKQQNNFETDEEVLSSFQQHGISTMEQLQQAFFEQIYQGNLYVNKLQENVIEDINITDAEAEEYYNNNKEQYKDDESEEVQAFSEVKDEIKEQLQTQKGEQEWQSLIEKLLDEADVEKNM